MITCNQLMIVCRQLNKLSLKDSIKLGSKYGIKSHSIKALRTILGCANTNFKGKLSPETRDKIAEEYKESRVSIKGLSIKYGVSYNAIRCILVVRNVEMNNFDYLKYTKRQVMYIKNELKKGTSVRKIASALGKSIKSIYSKISRMRENGEL